MPTTVTEASYDPEAAVPEPVTEHRGYQLPHPLSGDARGDAARLAYGLLALDVDVAGLLLAVADKADLADVYVKAQTYTRTEIDAAIQAAVDLLVGGAPGALDTLNEIAAALADDEDFAATMTAALAAKADAADVYTQTALDALLAAKANAADVYTQTALDALLAAKAAAADVYAKAETYTQAEVDAAIAAAVSLDIAAEQAASGASVERLNIPADAMLIIIRVAAVSLDDAGQLIVQMGGASGWETSGYDDAAITATATYGEAGFVVPLNGAGNTASGCLILARASVDGASWVAVKGGSGGSFGWAGGGEKTLAEAADRVRVLPSSAGALDAGAVTISVLRGSIE